MQRPDPVGKSQRDRRDGDLSRQLASALASGKAHDTQRALRSLLPDLMDRDIVAASRLAENLEPWASREQVLFQVAREWAIRDPAAAVTWARQIPDTAESDSVLQQACISVAQSDPLQALELAGNHDSLRNLILNVLARKDPDAALGWAGKQTDAGIRDSAYAQIALGQAESSPEEAARLVAERLPPGPLQDSTALAVLHQWMRRDPEAARAWVEIFPDGSLLMRAESELSGANAYPVTE